MRHTSRGKINLTALVYDALIDYTTRLSCAQDSACATAHVRPGFLEAYLFHTHESGIFTVLFSVLFLQCCTEQAVISQ